MFSINKNNRFKLEFGAQVVLVFKIVKPVAHLRDSTLSTKASKCFVIDSG